MRGSEFYNADYFRPKDKGGTGYYANEFIWENEGKRAMSDAAALISRYMPIRVLDVGCAKGFTVKAFLTLGIEAFGCDISQWAIDNCEKEARGRLTQIDVRNGLPYSNNSFDLICSMNTLEHIERRFLGFVVSEMFRVTKSWVHIEVPVIPGHKNAPWGDISHVTYMPTPYWISLFYKHGLLLEISRCTYDYKSPAYSVGLSFHRKDIFENG